MDTIILKFGGSSVADNIKLNIVAEKIIELKKEAKNIVVVVSAQGKTTDTLIREAVELAAVPNEREMDVLLSTGEQISASKLSILLNRMGHPAISLTGWQAGIETNTIHQNSKILQICTDRITKELELGKIVIVTGFQGIDENGDITTFGRGGSDTTAVALQASLNAEKCYIFSDVDGIYSADPNIVKISKRLDEISFEEMQEIADSGAKVLHNRCIHIGNKFNCNIIAKSTFSNKGGTKICKEIENSEIKSIVKNDKMITIFMHKDEQITNNDIFSIYSDLLSNNIIIEAFSREDTYIQFRIKKSEQNKVQEILEKNYSKFKIIQKDYIKLTIVGYGITQDNIILSKVIEFLKKLNVKILDINLNQSKIEIIIDKLDNKVLEELHKILI